MRSLNLTAVAALALSVVSAAGVAAASGGTMSPRSPSDTPCSFDQVVTLDPGFSPTPASGTYTSKGQTIPLSCTGSIDGKHITGPGTLGEVGRYGTSGPNSCTHIDGEFAQVSTMTLPTDAGPVHLTDATRGTYGLLQGGGAAGGTFDGPRFYGTFIVEGFEGDCVLTPITKLHLSVHGWLVEKG